MPGEHLDITAGDGPEPPADARLRPSPDLAAESARRRFVGIHFLCCDFYCRIYINREGTAYQGNCPRCSRPLLIRIGPGGTDSRFFTVS